jgi:hypothetical protein
MACVKAYQRLLDKFNSVDRRFDRLEEALLEIRRLLAAR